MRKDAPGHAAGFSLVELSIVLAVLAILAGLALPSLKDTLRRQRISATLYLLTTQLAQARITAITRLAPVTVCPSRGDGRCSTDTDWSSGWLVYYDPLRSTQPRSPDDILSDVRHPVPAPTQVFATTGRLRIRYQPDGSSGGSNLTLRLCERGVLQGEVVVNIAGRVKSQRQEGAACP